MALPSPPSASELLGLHISPAESPPIPNAGNFRGQPATTFPMSSSPPLDEIDECSLLARLDQKRREIEAEIEAFKAAKEEEYRELERRLWGEQKVLANNRKKRENGGASGGEKFTDATHAAGATSWENGAGLTTGGHRVFNSGTQIPLDLGGSKLSDSLRLELPDHRKQTGFDESISSSTTTSPPFEKELQAAGLFTPRYLPLLDNNYYRQTSPPISPPPQDPSTSVQTQTSPQQVIPKLATIPPSSSRAGNTSPAYPLASSLKSSSGSSTGTLSKSGAMKQKSPKRVTFQFEDENSVPSRSSPPPTKVIWSLEDENYPFEDEDGFVEDEGDEVEEVDEGEFDERGKVEQVEHVTAEGLQAMVGTRFPGDNLVVPTVIGVSGRSGGDSTIKEQSNAFNGLGISGVRAGPSNVINGNKADSESDEDQSKYEDDDDDEEALFDLDETIPEGLDNSPPHRDYSALTDSPQKQTNARLTAASFPMLPSFTQVPASASESILTFGKSPGPRPGLPRARRGSLSSSLSPVSNQNRFAQQEPIASSLPSFGWTGIDPPTAGFVPTPGGRFRRRSIVKYDLAEDDAASFKGKGKGKETQRAISEASDEDDDSTLLLSRSPNATSLPMSISRLSPAAFAAVSNAKRSPKPFSRPVVNNDIPDTNPVSARPSPKPRSPLAGAALFPARQSVPKIDSADLLASMSTSFTLAGDGTSPQKTDSVSSYRRSSLFPSAYDRTPYRTAYAAEVAAAAALDDEADYGGAMESVVGGVDGRTGLDPDLSSFRASSVAVGAGSRVRSGSIGGGMEALDPGRMSLGMRMAWESGKKESVARR